MAERAKSKTATYRNVATRLWDEPRFVALSATAKLVFLNVLTGRQSCAMPGLSRYSVQVAAEEIDVSLNTAKKAVKDIVDAGGDLAIYDPVARVIYVPSVLDVSAPNNPHVVAGWRRSWLDLPDCEPKRKAASDFDTHCRARGWDFRALVMSEQETTPGTTPETMPDPPGGGLGLQQSAIRDQDQETRTASSKQAPATPPRGGREAGLPSSRPPRAAAARRTESTESNDEGSDFVALNALSDVAPRDHKLGDIVQLAKTIDHRWGAWASARPGVVSDLDQAIRANYPRLVERMKREPPVTRPGGMFVTLLEDLVEPQALEAELDAQNPGRAERRRFRAEAEREALERAKAAERRANEERTAVARYESEKQLGETRDHFELRRQVEDSRRRIGDIAPTSVVFDGMRSRLERFEKQLEALEVAEAEGIPKAKDFVLAMLFWGIESSEQRTAAQRTIERNVADPLERARRLRVWDETPGDSDEQRAARRALLLPPSDPPSDLDLAIAGGEQGSEAERAARDIIRTNFPIEPDRQRQQAAWWAATTTAERRIALGLGGAAKPLARVRSDGGPPELLAAEGSE